MKTKNILLNTRGSALMTTLFFLTVAAILVGILWEYSSTEIVQTRRQVDSKKAFYNAHAGLQLAKATFTKTTGGGFDSFAKILADPGTDPNVARAYDLAKFDFFDPTDGKRVLTPAGSPTTIVYTDPGLAGTYTVALPQMPANFTLPGGGTCTVTIVSSARNIGGAGTGDIILQSRGTYNGSTRAINEAVRFRLYTSTIFNYGLFLNQNLNLGVGGGGNGTSIRVDGDVLTNGVAFLSGDASNLVINGSLSINQFLTGTTPSHMTLGDYYADAGGRGTWSRPGNPADPSPNPDPRKSSLYAPGYNDKMAGVFEKRPIEDMPYLGAVNWADNVLQVEKQVSSASGGTKQENYIEYWDSDLGMYVRIYVDLNANISANPRSLFTWGPYGGGVVSKGKYAKFYRPDNNRAAFYFEGPDVDHPVRINGTILVPGDIHIQGYIQGQGLIFAERNMYVGGDLINVAPPSYNLTDPNPYDTYSKGGKNPPNKERDVVVLVASGMVVLGDYTNNLDPKYPLFNDALGKNTKYVIEKEDIKNGYLRNVGDIASIKGSTDKNCFFNGNYTNQDTFFDAKWDGWTPTFGTPATQSDGNTRSFYKSTFGDKELKDTFHPVTRIDASFVTKHAIVGVVGNPKFTLHGAIISYEEALFSNGSIDIKYDERLHSSHGGESNPGNILLPNLLSNGITMGWREVP